jgi:exonuclease III
MKILSLNCQGLGNASAVLSLLNVQRHYIPDVLFFSETHLDIYPAECLRRRLKMDFKIVSPSNGRSGGVILLWRKEVVIQQLFVAPKYIDVKIVESPGKIWRFTGIYGEPRWEDKYKTWDMMRNLNGNNNLPWLIMGDFNEISFSHEKEGGNPRPQVYMQAFRDAMNDCELEDIGFVGNQFTWKSGRIRERLDRALANADWSGMHPSAELIHLDFVKSDHRPILIDTEHRSVPQVKQSRPRRFEAKWLREQGFTEVVQQAWDSM